MFTGSSSCGDTPESSLDISVNTFPAPTVGTITQPTCPSLTGSVFLSGLPNPWTLTRTPGGTTSGTGTSTTISGLAPNTTYTFTVTNAAGCISGPSINVDIGPAPVSPTITGNLNLCAGFTTQLTASGTPNGTTPWSSATISVATINSTGMVTGVSAGTSVITYRDINSCSTTTTITVTGSPTITGTLSVCIGSDTQLTGSGTPAASSPWVSSNTSFASVDNSGLVTGISAGTSVITYTNSTGCSRNVTITVNALPAAPIPATPTQPTCILTTGSVVLSGLPSGNWTINPGNITGNTANRTINGLNPNTTYNFTVANSLGCISGPSNDVVINALPGSPTITGTLSICTGFTTQLTGSGTPAASSPWVSATTSVATVNSSGLVTGVSAGTSIITYTDNNGCYSTATLTVNISPTITGTLSVCVGSTTQLTGSGTPAVLTPWISATPGVALISNTGLVTGVIAGTSIITYTNSNGCSINTTVTVNALPTAPVPGTLTQPTCASPTGSIRLTGLPSPSINWTITWPPSGSLLGSGAASPLISLFPGTYNFKVKNNITQCVSAASVDVVINPQPVTPPAPNISVEGPTTFCTGGNVTLTSSAGSTYVWSTGATTPSITISTAGSYTVQVTNPAGCLSPASAATLITVNPNVTPTFTAIGPLCQNTTPPALSATSTNSITGTWSPATISTATVGTTTYTFTPTSGQCATSTTLNITINPSITPTFAALGPLCQNATPPALPITSTNSITGTWSPASISTSTDGTTTYNFTPTAGQCATTTTLNITVDPNIIPTFAAIGPLCQNSTPPALPITSTNSITGTWSPATISTSTAGTTTYTFTPTPVSALQQQP